MRRPPNPYRVLAHALDVGDRRLAEALTFRLAAVGLSGPRQGAAAEATVERLNAALELIEVLERNVAPVRVEPVANLVKAGMLPQPDRGRRQEASEPRVRRALDLPVVPLAEATLQILLVSRGVLIDRADEPFGEEVFPGDQEAQEDILGEFLLANGCETPRVCPDREVSKAEPSAWGSRAGTAILPSLTPTSPSNRQQSPC
ncbi:MAG: hypothetical protein M3R46_12235 [Actinomycetota bacterium]|jgi:hypothetical protein|nr:hypothetical protein [Actinomycetota bacterium]